MTSPERTAQDEQHGLRRDLGKLANYATLIGTMVGSGILIVPSRLLYVLANAPPARPDQPATAHP